jgi:hypothetical protein
LLPAIAASPGPNIGDDRRGVERFGFNPKNSGPDHAVPVIALAVAESER